MKKQSILFIAPGSHKRCFVCGDKRKKLIEIHRQTIIYALRVHKMVIRTKSRCCGHHLDKNRDLYKDQYHFIKTKPIKCDKTSIFTLQRNPLNQINGIFDQFKNMLDIDDETCRKITGWSRNQFLLFSKYINSINDTAGRTKEQLIAMYRFWLMNGNTQNTIALSKSSLNQQEISHYLSTIRKSIYSDFVPLFLGSSRPREFFIKHNNVSVITLHNLDQGDLVLIADGTYLKCEKSRNNNFQYLSYSAQKKCSLIKPFIICCPDGYIVDVYGPYGGKFNDTKIFDHIFQNDKHLKALMQPSDKTYLFLDRGELNYYIFR